MASKGRKREKGNRQQGERERGEQERKQGWNDSMLRKTQDLENKLMDMGGRGGGIVKEFGIDLYTLLYLKWTTNKDLL